MPRLASLTLVAAFAALALAAACGAGKPTGMSGPTMNNKVGGGDLPPPVSPVVSQDILAREPVANSVKVVHILIGWKDLADAYDGHIDPRAANRTEKQAEALVSSIMGQLKAGADFDTLMKQYSEDSASAESGEPIPVSPDAHLVIEFRMMGLRLEVGEIGVVQSDYGFHIMKRVE